MPQLPTGWMRPLHVTMISLLLLLAAVHCTLSIFYANESWLDLAKYAEGVERNPFQERIAMMPVLRLAERSKAVGHLAEKIGRRNQKLYPSEPMTAEKLASLFVALLSVLGALVVTALSGAAIAPKLWWMPPVLVLAILYSSYAARYEHAIWFPYDLPQMFVFGAACVCLLSGRVAWFLVLFCLDLPMRETSVYLIALSAVLLASRMPRKWIVVMAALMTLAWFAVHLPIVHHFQHNPGEAGSELRRNLATLRSPLDWPTLASAFGFLIVPVWLARRYLDRRTRLFLWISLPCILVTDYFGILIETRIFLEWTMPIAVLATVELARWLEETRTEHVVAEEVVLSAPGSSRGAGWGRAAFDEAGVKDSRARS